MMVLFQNRNFILCARLSLFATENEDYTLPHDNVSLTISLTNNVPIRVTLTLLNDGVAGEEVENVTLSLVNTVSPDENEILLYDTVTISILDNDSKCISLDTVLCC